MLAISDNPSQNIITFSKLNIVDFPDLYAIKTSTGKHFFYDGHAYSILSGLDKESTNTALHRYYKKHHDDDKDFPSILTDPPDSEHVCTFVDPTSGKVLKAFSLAGLEFLCNHITGKNAEESKPKFLKLIESFRASFAQETVEPVHHELPTHMTAALQQNLPFAALSQALAAPLQALVALNAERVSEMVKAMAEKDLEIEKAKHAAEIEAVKNEAKIKDLEKSHQIELERVKHEAERAQWELKAASIRQGQRDEPERDFTREPEVPQPTGQHANLKAASACLWLALYGAPKRMDACHFNRHSAFVKACSSILVDREDDTWIALIELEKPMNIADLTKELKPLAKEVFFVFELYLFPIVITPPQDVFTGPVFLESRGGRTTKNFDSAALLEAKGDYFNRESRKLIVQYTENTNLVRYNSGMALFPFIRVLE